MHRISGTHHRETIRPPLRLTGGQEAKLHRAAEELPLAYRGRFHSHVRKKLMGVVDDAQLFAVIHKVRRAILHGARLAAKGG
jgi:hypothetical protein